MGKRKTTREESGYENSRSDLRMKLSNAVLRRRFKDRRLQYTRKLESKSCSDRRLFTRRRKKSMKMTAMRQHATSMVLSAFGSIKTGSRMPNHLRRTARDSESRD